MGGRLGGAGGKVGGAGGDHSHGSCAPPPAVTTQTMGSRGRGHAMWLFSRSQRTGTLVCAKREAHTAGMVPCSSLFWRWSSASLSRPWPYCEKPDHSGGRVPEMALKERTSCSSCAMRQKCGGSVPLSLFRSSARVVSELSAPHCHGNVPLSEGISSRIIKRMFAFQKGELPHSAGSVPEMAFSMSPSAPSDMPTGAHEEKGAQLTGRVPLRRLLCIANEDMRSSTAHSPGSVPLSRKLLEKDICTLLRLCTLLRTGNTSPSSRASSVGSVPLSVAPPRESLPRSVSLPNSVGSVPLSPSLNQSESSWSLRSEPSPVGRSPLKLFEPTLRCTSAEDAGHHSRGSSPDSSLYSALRDCSAAESAQLRCSVPVSRLLSTSTETSVLMLAKTLGNEPEIVLFVSRTVFSSVSAAHSVGIVPLNELTRRSRCCSVLDSEASCDGSVPSRSLCGSSTLGS